MNFPNVLDIKTIVPPHVKNIVKSSILNDWFYQHISRHRQAILVFVAPTQYQLMTNDQLITLLPPSVI